MLGSTHTRNFSGWVRNYGLSFTSYRKKYWLIKQDYGEVEIMVILNYYLTTSRIPVKRMGIRRTRL